MTTKTVNMHEAKAHLSRLVQGAVGGEPFVIAKAGKPLVRVEALTAPARGEARRTGFLSGEFEVPDDFDRMGRDEIEDLFGIEGSRC